MTLRLGSVGVPRTFFFAGATGLSPRFSSLTLCFLRTFPLPFYSAAFFGPFGNIVKTPRVGTGGQPRAYVIPTSYGRDPRYGVVRDPRYRGDPRNLGDPRYRVRGLLSTSKPPLEVGRCRLTP